VDAVRALEADSARSSDTHLFEYPWPLSPHVQLFLKDESTHLTGSLKHRLARSLFLHAICSGWIVEGTEVFEASSGSTAVSEAYFARMLGLTYTAVMPSTTSRSKIDLIEFYGGHCHLVEEPSTVNQVAADLARSSGGHFLDQFTYAERATDWRGNNNIAESVFAQLRYERHPVPRWVVVGAGTGGTSATFGRYMRYRRLHSELCVVDPENSVFYDFWHGGPRDQRLDVGSRIEGIGRPHVEASFLPSVIDEMIRVPDAASIASIRHAEEVLGRRVGPSTGTNLWGAHLLAQRMIESGEPGSIVTLICDDGHRYADTCYDDAWLADQGIDIAPYLAELRALG
jgi:cysteine synthase A